jgi:hypothetical protein
MQPRYQTATHENNTRSCTYSLDAPDDERIYCSKHVEQSGTNKLSYTVASSWSFYKLYHDSRNLEYQTLCSSKIFIKH